MLEIWPQLLVLVVLLALFLFLILRLRPDVTSWTRQTNSAERMYARLERSPLILILCALIAIIFMIVLVHGVYRAVRVWNRPDSLTTPASNVQAMLAQLASELEEYHRTHDGLYPEDLDVLDEASESWVLPATDPYRTPPGRVDYRTDGSTWWLLRSYGPDRVSGLPGDPLDLDRYHGEPMQESPLRRYLYDPSNGLDSTGDIVQVGGSRFNPPKPH